MARGQQAQQEAQPQAGAGSGEGLPAGLRRYTPFPFKGIDAKGSVAGIADDNFVWLENIVWIGPGQLAFLNSNNPFPVYTTTGGLTIASYFFFSIPNFIGDVIVFLSDGSAVIVNPNTFAVTALAGAGTFALTPTLPVATQWASKYLLIGDSAGYYIWDGTSFYKPGTLAPQVLVSSGGLNYSGPPTVAISGGSGTGATATAILANGRVVDVVITNPGSGYLPTDSPLLVATFTGGGNSNKIAQGTASVGGGGVVSVTVTDGGTGYTNQPSVTFSGGGASTQATGVAQGATVGALSIANILVVTPGVGYTSDPTVTIGAPSGGGNTATANATIGLNGILSVTVTDGGDSYATTPTVVITDPTGFGTGAAAVANMSSGTVASVTVTNPGQNYQNAVVRFVGGNPLVAAATLQLMPAGGQFPVSASAIETFKNRVWMVNKTHRFTSAPGSVSDFAATDGGIISENTDSFLAFNLLGLKQAGGFLYEFGDSSVNAISNPVTTITNNLATTAVTITNVDPQIGCLWPLTIQNFGEAIVFASPLGVYELFGSSVKKISTDLDDILASNLTQPQLPSSAIVIINNIKFYALSIFVFDPIQRINRQLILLWDGFRWFVATQVANIISLRTLNTGGNYIGFGSDGTNIYQCFLTPSTSLQKKIISKFYGIDSAEHVKQSLRFYFAAEQGCTYDVTIHGEVADSVLPTTNYPGAAGPSVVSPYGNQLNIQGQDAPAYGKFLGWTLTSYTATCTVDYMALAYRFYAPYY